MRRVRRAKVLLDELRLRRLAFWSRRRGTPFDVPRREGSERLAGERDGEMAGAHPAPLAISLWRSEFVRSIVHNSGEDPYSTPPLLQIPARPLVPRVRPPQKRDGVEAAPVRHEGLVAPRAEPRAVGEEVPGRSAPAARLVVDRGLEDDDAFERLLIDRLTLTARPVFTRFLSAFVRGFQCSLRPIKFTLVVVAAWTATKAITLNHGWASRARRPLDDA